MVQADLIEPEDGPALEDPPSQGNQPKFIFSADEASLRSKKKRKDIEGIEDEDDEDDAISERKKNPGRRKIDIEYIQDKSKRHITFSKRKAGIMKKVCLSVSVRLDERTEGLLLIAIQAYELATLTGTQLLLLVVSETGIVYTFTTPNLQPIVSDDPGKSLISSCLNDGEAEIRIEQEDPEEESPTHPAGPAEEHDLLVMPPNHSAPSGTTGHLQQPISESYHPDNQGGALSSSLATSNTIPYFHESSEPLSQPYNSIFMNPSGIQNVYPNLGQEIGLSAPDNLGTIPNLQICPPGPLNLQENQAMFSMDGFMQMGDPSESRKIKRRRTETDLRQRATLSNQNPIPPPLPNQFPFDVQHNWLEAPDPMKLGAIPAGRSTVFDAPPFNSVVSSFLLQESGHFHGPMDLESTNRNLQSQMEHHVVLFLDACDHYPLGDTTLNSRKWRQDLFPRKQLLAGCLKFFFEEYLPLLKHLPFEGLASCCEDLQKLAQFVSIFYEDPEQATAELCEIIKSSSGAYMQSVHLSAHSSTSTQGAPVTSPLPSAFNTRLKCAPKLKPRKGVNITLRGGRLQTVLEEYTDWCRKNKSSWSGNKPNSHVKGWFKIERVRRTFCCCAIVGENHLEGIPAVLKIRFPASAIKLIRKEDKLELEVQNSDDGSEWNIFNHFNFELCPGDEQEEEETSVLSCEGAVDSLLLQKICEEKKLSPPDAQRWIENQRLMKLYVEAGDFDDDGFESKVPPKGGKQAFRVKKPSIAGPKPSDSSQFELEDLANMKALNSPH
ncbi:transcription factor of the MADS box [Puccinia graminis f. sp. tritici]|uniref:Transcription factor of the MADS box n=1 Tax=Puccinia graminis f. sp. tritici TaxID=56615 RepID=A0A5B0MYG9_PUCGR|nr:transcription factor of the MADS box [Puccinia graminis f. sp. tritici]